MKITNKQLWMIMIILQDSQKDIMGVFSYDLKTRNTLLNQIINQQSDDVVEIGNNEESVNNKSN